MKAYIFIALIIAIGLIGCTQNNAGTHQDNTDTQDSGMLSEEHQIEADVDNEINGEDFILEDNEIEIGEII